MALKCENLFYSHEFLITSKWENALIAKLSAGILKIVSLFYALYVLQKYSILRIFR